MSDDADAVAAQRRVIEQLRAQVALLKRFEVTRENARHAAEGIRRLDLSGLFADDRSFYADSLRTFERIAAEPV